MPTSAGRWRQVSILAVSGAMGFWCANLAISLTPIAADYRAALSIRYVPMLIEAILGGLLIGTCVSYVLTRYPDRIPTTTPLAKSLILSLVALGVVTVLVEVPGKLLTSTPDAWHYLIVATSFNAVRILTLGLVIGSLAGRLSRTRRIDAARSLGRKDVDNQP